VIIVLTPDSQSKAHDVCLVVIVILSNQYVICDRTGTLPSFWAINY